METVFDWVTITIFAGLVVLFLQRSTSDENDDSIWPYLGGALGCAVANYIGNAGHTLLASLIVVATLAYIVLVLKPINFGAPR